MSKITINKTTEPPWHILFFLKCVPLILGAILLTAGCATIHKKKLIPGNPNLADYGLNFNIDWNVFDSGTYIYGPEGTEPTPISGYIGLQDFYVLILDLNFKDGRKYHEKIDIKPLIKHMVKDKNIHDLSTDKWGGRTALNVGITRNKITINYTVYEYKIEENPKRHVSKKYVYPVFERPLN